MKGVLLALIGLLGLGHSISRGQGVRGGAITQNRILQFGIVDCVGHAKLTVSRLAGVVVGPSAAAIPNATVFISANQNARITTTTDSKGHFLLSVPAGEYVSSVKATPLGFARRASLRFETKQTIWQRGFTDHRIRDMADYEQHKQYIRMNPAKARLCISASQYPYSSALGRYKFHPIPQGLKPVVGVSQAARLKPCPSQCPWTAGLKPQPDRILDNGEVGNARA